MMQQIEVIQTPPAPVQPAPAQATPGQGGLLVQTPGGVVHLPGGASPRAVLRGAEAKRERLGDLMSRVRNRRDETSRKLQDGRVTGADRAGLEKYIQELDARIIDIEHQMQQAERELAAASAVPGAQIPERLERGGGRNDFPEELIAIPIVFTIFVLFPIAIAFSRRIWKRTGTAIAQTPAWMNERFSRMEQAVDAIAIEVERISEGQRFMTKLFSEGGRSLGQGAAQPVEVPVREHVPQGTT